MGSLVVVDACVFFRIRSTDLVMWAYRHYLCIPQWTKKIDEEWISNVVMKNKTTREKALDRSRCMRDFVMGWEIEDFEDVVLEHPLPDKGDNHVLKAAVKGECSWILTFNIKDFPQELLEPLQVSAIHPDDFFVGLALEAEESFREVIFDSLANDTPPMSISQYLGTLESAGLIKLSKCVESNWNRWMGRP